MSDIMYEPPTSTLKQEDLYAPRESLLDTFADKTEEPETTSALANLLRGG